MDINQEEWEARLGSDLSRVCRLCLKTCEAFHPIFNSNEPENKQTLSHKIMACAQVKVFEGDGLPTHVCNSCFSQVERFYQFKLLCERSDNKLRGSIVNIIGNSDSDDMEDSEDVDMTQLTPEVIIDEAPSSIVTHEHQNNLPKPQNCESSNSVFSRIMQGVLGQSSLIQNSSKAPSNHQKKEPVYLKGLPGFVHSNQEMARMAVAMALHQRSIQDQQKKSQEKHQREITEQQQLRQRAAQNREEESGSSSKSRRCRNGVKAFKCTQCNKSYSFSSALSRHKAVHNPQLRPHFCNICNKGFTQVEKLSRHQRTHALDAAVFSSSRTYGSGRDQNFYAGAKEPTSSRTSRGLIYPLDITNEIKAKRGRQNDSIDLPPIGSEHVEISIRPDLYPDTEGEDEEMDEEDDEEEVAVDRGGGRQNTTERVVIKTEPPGQDEVVIKEELPDYNDRSPTDMDLSQVTIKKEIKQEDKVSYPPPSGKGKPEFRCSVCLKCFATRGSLEVHSNIHTGVRPFVCKVCQQAFRHKVNLIEHFQRKHSQVRPYHCDICASRFVTKQELLRHYRKHIGD